MLGILTSLQTGGYPSLNLREFLNLLSKHPLIQDVPFYFFSDHDVFGSEIYCVLKYGSKATAWASPTLICSRLEWAGPTTAALEASVKIHGSFRKTFIMTSNPQKTEEQVLAEALEWETCMLARLRKRMMNKKINADASARYKHLQTSGILSLPGEQAFATELKAMKENSEVSLN